jgi:hypothetical protein
MNWMPDEPHQGFGIQSLLAQVPAGLLTSRSAYPTAIRTEDGIFGGPACAVLVKLGPTRNMAPTSMATISGGR